MNVNGLSTKQAHAQKKRHGPNQIHKPYQLPWVLQYLWHFKNPLVLILLIASFASAATGEITNAIIILVIVFLSVTLDFVQEYRSQSILDHLLQKISIFATVRRDGVPTVLPASEIVPGDVILLKAGDLIPADGWLLRAHDFFINQAALTGESIPVEKHPSSNHPSIDDFENAPNAVFTGSSVISGFASMVVHQTGNNTVIGRMANAQAWRTPANSFELGIRRFGYLILQLTFFMVLFVLLVGIVWHQHPWLTYFLFAVALAVGLTPELLPMVTSITLARGAMRMAANQMIVKRISAIQDLGSMDVLCTDKTGTLTEASIRVETHINLHGQLSDLPLEFGFLNSFFSSGFKSSLDEAILQCAPFDVHEWKKIDEISFDFEKRRVSVLLEKSGYRWQVVKGAPDEVLSLCSYATENHLDSKIPLNDDVLQTAKNTYHALEVKGFRVLGVGLRRWHSAASDSVNDKHADFIFLGFIAFSDPPKLSAGGTLQALENLGINIKIITGDSELVTRNICEQLGLREHGMLLGQEMKDIDDIALLARVEHVNLYCRMSPVQKNRIIHALKNKGHVVGYLGDGINDVPSIQTADVGLSVDSGVDAAKAAADMILLKHDLGVLHDAVIEGRRTFGNIMKYIMMSTSSNFGNMLSMAVAVTFLPFLPMLPTQILLNNILYDISEVAIPFDKVDQQDIEKPRVLNIQLIQGFMLTMGPISSVFDLITFYVMLEFFALSEPLFQTGWFMESLCTQVLVIFVIRTRRRFWQSHPHPTLIATSLIVVVLALVIPVTPLAVYFGLYQLPLAFYAFVLLMTIGYLLVADFVKTRFFQRYDRHLTSVTGSAVNVITR